MFQYVDISNALYLFYQFIPDVIKIFYIITSSISRFVFYVINFIITTTPSNEFLSDVAAFEGVLIAISLPLSLNVVIRATERYDDQEISQIFTREKLYRFQKVFLLFNISISIFLRFLDLKNSIILWTILIMLLVCVFVFYKFIYLVEQYSSNTDKLLLSRFKKNVEKVLKK